MSADFVIIGGGCYGSYYVGQLLEARTRGKLSWERLLVLDRVQDCAVASRFPNDDVAVECIEWENWGKRLWADPDEWSEAQLVPAPIAPHVVRHWLVTALEAEGATISDATWGGDVPSIPYADVTAAGQLVVSHAPGLCPTNCIEPRSCPLTGGPRTWDMPDTVRAAANNLVNLAVLECRHFAYGVGTIPISTILAAREKFLRIREDGPIGIATVSGCHGLVDTLRVGW